MNPFFNQEFDSNEDDEEYIPESGKINIKIRILVKQRWRRVTKSKIREKDKKETDKDKIKNLLETLKNKDNPGNNNIDNMKKDDE
jgi:hypothetical protein